MNSLEKSVTRLAGALDALEARLEDRLAEQTDRVRAHEKARSEAGVARAQAAAAADSLAGAIRDLKTLLSAGKGG